MTIIDTNKRACLVRTRPDRDDWAVFVTREDALAAPRVGPARRMIVRAMYSGAWNGWIVTADRRANSYLRMDGTIGTFC